jgi:hypothetical protein
MGAQAVNFAPEFLWCPNLSMPTCLALPSLIFSRLWGLPRGVFAFGRSTRERGSKKYLYFSPHISDSAKVAKMPYHQKCINGSCVYDTDVGGDYIASLSNSSGGNSSNCTMWLARAIDWADSVGGSSDSVVQFEHS